MTHKIPILSDRSGVKTELSAGMLRSSPMPSVLASGLAASSAASVASGAAVTLHQLKSQKRKPGEASFFFFDNHFQRNAVKILPGEYFVSKDDIVIMTVLGSCIAACLWDSRANIGGMNHFMLPEGGPMEATGRYGSYAMELLINEMLKLGARRENLQAKIFGGARVMHNFTTIDVGLQNSKFVVNYLKEENIKITSEDILDIYPRKVVLSPITGKVMVKRLAHTHPEKINKLDKSGSVQLVVKKTAGGSVDLF